MIHPTWRTGGIAVGLALSMACGADGNIAPPPPPPVPPPGPPPSVTATVGAEGGIIDGPGGVRLAIAPGALAASTQIVIAQDGAGAPPPPAGSSVVGPVFSLTPHGLGFRVPVTLSLPAGSNSGAVFLKTNRAGDGWEQPEAVASNGVITAAITGFSWGAVYCCFPAPNVSGPADRLDVPEGGFWIFNVSVAGSGPFAYQWYRGGLLLAGETTRTFLIDPAHMSDDGALFSVRVVDRNGVATTSRAARLGVVALPPVIVGDPADAQVVAGASAIFSGASTSSIAQTLQWQRSNDGGQSWTDLVGATSTSYTLTNAHLTNDNNAQFRFRAANASPLGPQPVASRAARLTVTGVAVAPTIVTPPRSVTVTTGASAGFSVVAAGTSLDYQWERAATSGGPFAPVPNATSATFTISNAASTDHLAAFRVRVSNTAGSALSPEAVLTVLRAPTVALVRVAGGDAHSVALRGNGTLIAWGANTHGQLGDGTTIDRLAPGQVGGPVAAQCSVATFAVGWKHNLALCANGDLWSWGGDEHGELGMSGQGADVLLAQRSSGGPARHVAASRGVPNLSSSRPGQGTPAHSLAALANNPLAAAWGANESGQLGDGLLVLGRGPGLVPNLGGPVKVAAGAQFSLALRSDGTVWTWGANSYGNLGLGTTIAALSPTPVPGLRNIIEIAAGLQFAMAIDQNGALFAWGDNQLGQLGDGTRIDRFAPVSVPLPRPVVAIALGSFHALALLDDGTVYGWGSNGYGAVGIGPTGGGSFSSTPRLLSSGLPGQIIAIGAGGDHSLAVDGNLDVWAWGRNNAGQLGDGTLVDRGTPARVNNANLR